MHPAYIRPRRQARATQRKWSQQRRRIWLRRVSASIPGKVVARPQHFYVNDAFIILPDINSVPSGSWVLIGYINQSVGPTIELENTTDDSFAGVSVGAASSLPIQLTNAGEVMQFVSDRPNRLWISISRDH